MRIRLIIVVCFVWISNFFVYGQYTNDTIAFERFSIGITPSAFLNVYSAVQLNFNFGLTKNLKAVLETGHIFYNMRSKNSQGYRLKYGIEWMVKTSKYSSTVLGFNGIYRKVEEVTYRSVSYPERYIQKFEIDLERELKGIQFTVGKYFKLNKNFSMSYAFGWGIGSLEVSDDSNLDFGDEPIVFNLYRNPGNYYFPIISFNLKYMYILARLK